MASSTHDPATDTPTASPSASDPPKATAALTLGAIGVVYGDIGTSPLYTVKEIFAPATGVALDAANLIGAVSVVFWALMLVVTLKYVVLVLRADHRGEGGTLALAALAAKTMGHRPALRRTLLLIGVFGATLFYGDSVITPAISVLGAVEGLQLVTPAFGPYIVPLAVAVLVALFAVQRHGTGVVGRWFGPIITLWFLTLGAVGLWHVVREPAILAALNPVHAWDFLWARGWQLFVVVGAVVLALTGAEALYADMGHFGRRPIQRAWTGLVLPSLALNYMGQGALLMGDPSAIDNPFYRLFPDFLLWPVLLLATLAAVIASQAVITGAYSMTQQAVQLGFLPRMTVRYTSARAAGQIYLPAVNRVLLVGVVLAVVLFGSSSALAGAYGVAVTMTMLVTSLLTFFVMRARWRLPAPVAMGLTLFFVAIDLLLLVGCAMKFFDGGWFPLALAGLLFAGMTSWARGRERLLQAIREDGLPLDAFIRTLDERAAPRVDRVAIYPVADAATVPSALLHNLKHNQVLHRCNVLVTVNFRDVPWVGFEERVQVRSLGHGFWHVTAHFGFMQRPDVPKALTLTTTHGLHIPPFESSYFLSRDKVVTSAGRTGWRDHLFAAMSRNAGDVVPFFRLPINAVVELGTRVHL